MPVTVETYATLSEAARAFAAHRSARFLGGGTILMRALNEAAADIETIVRTTDPSLRTIRREGQGVRLGAHVTMAEIALNRDTAFLAPVARVIGGPQVRAAATVAGNLFAESPYGDFAAALMALGAEVETADGRTHAVEGFVTAPPRAVVAAVSVPDPRGAFRFAKVTRVKPKGVSLMSISVLLPSSGAPRIVFNGMGARPVRAHAAERALGERAGQQSIERAAAAATEGLQPLDDALASAWYRKLWPAFTSPGFSGRPADGPQAPRVHPQRRRESGVRRGRTEPSRRAAPRDR